MSKAREKPEIAYLLPGLFLSGGISVALRHVHELRKRGRDAVIFCLNMDHDPSWCPFISDIPVYPFGSYYEICGASGAGHLVATWWETAFDVASVDATSKHYFLQSIEGRFFPDGHPFRSAFYLSLLLGLDIFTEAKWIRDWLKFEVGLAAEVVPNGIDLSVFHSVDFPAQPRKFRVLIEGSPKSPFKGVKESFEALRGLDVETWYVSPDADPDPAWRIDRFFKAVPLQKMPEIYSQCDVLLKLSKVEGVFGPPLEMMACGGTCIVGKVTGADEYCVHEQNCLMVDAAAPEAAAGAVKRLMEDGALLARLKSEGAKTASTMTWDKSADILEASVFTESGCGMKLFAGEEMCDAFVNIKRHLGENLQMRLVIDESKSRFEQVSAELKKTQGRLETAVNQNVEKQARLDAVEAQWLQDRKLLDEIQNSRGWRFLRKCCDALDRVAPENTARRKILAKLAGARERG